MRKYSRKICLAVVFSLAIMGCSPSTPVTVDGKSVTNETFITTTIAVRDVEASAVALGDYLIQRHVAGCGGKTLEVQRAEPVCVSATAALKTYATQYAPKILAGVVLVREELKVLALAPGETTEEKVTRAVSVATIALQAAVEWATHTQSFPQGTLR